MSSNTVLMTFGGHLNVLRKVFIRVCVVTIIFASVIFAFKDFSFALILSPSECDFCTYRWIENFMQTFNPNFHFDKFYVELIATDLSSQFMTHITASLYLGLLCASPYILFELFKFISPALLESEKKYSVWIVCIIYVLFILGVLMSYFVLFPISFRFLGTYSVSHQVHSTITLDSYISTFVMLTIVMGLVFQLPVIAFLTAKMGLVRAEYLQHYRRYAFLIICVLAAIITPPDVLTLVLVALPLYALYEVSIRVIRSVQSKTNDLTVKESI